jgi:hypothetical protein
MLPVQRAVAGTWAWANLAEASNDRAGAVGDLAAVLAAGARLNDRVERVVVGEGPGLELPAPGLRQRVAAGVGVVDLGNAVEVLAVQAVARLVLLGQQAERRPAT